MFMKSFLLSGAGSGIGREIAISIAKQSSDHSIVLLGRRRENLEDTLSRLPNRQNHLVIAADIRDPSALRAAFSKAAIEKRNLVGIIANAGIGGENEYGASDRWQEILNTNLSGTYFLVNEALGALRASASPYKHVLIVSSILARLGVPKYSAYCASKAGLLGLMRSWASEFSRENILVNAICPGWVETEMAEAGLRAMSEGQGIGYEEVKKSQMNMLPLKKMSAPEEIGALVAFLLSGSQVSITGQCLDINNGALMP
jgi:NAD(P)-dependent dehydrogenase (short-subunit alcohol dehydrogenase family)